MANVSDQIPSPCVRNCCLDEDDVCLGCFRTLSEVVRWSESDNDAREMILENARVRRHAHNERYKHL